MPDMVEVLLKTIQTRVLVVLNLLPHSTEVHRVFDHVQVIRYLGLCVRCNNYWIETVTRRAAVSSLVTKESYLPPLMDCGSQKHYWCTWWKLYTHTCRSVP